MFKKIIINLVVKIVKPSIIFESVPNFSDNTRAVYDEMVRRGYAKKYRMVWLTDWNQYAIIDGSRIKYLKNHEMKSIVHFFTHLSVFHNTKCLICCNRFLASRGNRCVTHGTEQVSFYLTHGTPMKSVKKYYTSNGDIDYVLSPANALEEVIANEFNFSSDQVFTAGFPRNDVLTQPTVDLRKILGINNKKIVVWYPTYRQNTDNSVVTSHFSLPILHNEENAKRLNEIVRRLDIMIILKAHYVQDMSKIPEFDLSNIVFINDTFFQHYGITSYQLLAGSDALLTDYSSVYFDYTLCDKPIGVIWEDIETYNKFPGFAVDLDMYLKGAVKIYNLAELQSFLEDVVSENDQLQNERRIIRDLTNYSTDGKNTERVVDFIVQKARL